MKLTPKRFFAQERYWYTNRERCASVGIGKAVHTLPDGGKEDGVALFVGKNITLCMTDVEAAALADTLIDEIEARK